MVFLKKTYTFHEISVFGLKHDLGSFLCVFWSLGDTSGTLLAPFLVFLGTLGAPGPLSRCLGDPLGALQEAPGSLWAAPGAYLGI